MKKRIATDISNAIVLMESLRPEQNSDSIKEVIKAFQKTPFAIFRNPFFGSGFSLGTFPTEGEPCFHHSPDTSEENKPKREAAIQAEFITSVQKQAALIKTGDEPAGLQLPAHAYTDPIVCRRILKGLLFGTISKAFTIGTNTLTLDVAFQREIADKLRTDLISLPDGLKALAENLSAFTDPEAQKHLAEAIFDGKFGNSPAVLTALAQNLPKFTEPKAQKSVAFSIFNQKLGQEPAVLKALAENLSVFTEPEAQALLAHAIFVEKFGETPAVLTALAKSLSVFKDKDAQTFLAEAIFDEKFGDNPEVLKALAENLSVFTEPDAQKRVAEAIFRDKFGDTPEVLKALAENLSVFKDKDAQTFLAHAILNDKFGKGPAVLTALAENLPKFTEPKAQKHLAHAILEGKFEDDPAALTALAQNLPKFTEPKAQEDLAKAIFDGKFGDNPAVLTALAKSLSVFKDKDAQKRVADAILNDKFPKDPAVITALAENLSVFTDKDAQKRVVLAIFRDKFGNSPAVLKVLAEKLSAFTERNTKKVVTKAILKCLSSLGDKFDAALQTSLMADLIPDDQIEPILKSQSPGEGGYRIHHLLEAAIQDEVKSTLGEGTLFRANTFSSKLIGAFFKRLGIPEKCIPQEVFNAIDAVPNKELLTTLQIEANTYGLTPTRQDAVALATNVIDALTNQAAVDTMPAAVKFIAKSIGKALRGTNNVDLQALKSSEAGMAKAIGSLVDLRLRMPALALKQVEGKIQPNYTLVSKIVTTLSNQAAASNKEQALKPVMDALIEAQCTEKLINFYTNLDLQYEA